MTSRFDFSDVTLPSTTAAPSAPSRFDFSDVQIPTAPKPAPPTEPYYYGSGVLAKAAGLGVGGLIDLFSMLRPAPPMIESYDLDTGQVKLKEPGSAQENIEAAMRRFGGTREPFYPAEKYAESILGTGLAMAPVPAAMALGALGGGVGEYIRQEHPQYAEYSGIAEALPLFAKAGYDLRKLPGALYKMLMPQSGAQQMAREVSVVGPAAESKLGSLAEKTRGAYQAAEQQAASDLQKAQAAEQAAATNLGLAAEERAAAGLEGRRLSPGRVAIQPVAIEQVAADLAATDAPREIVREVDQVIQPIVQAQQEAFTATRQAMNQKLNLRDEQGTLSPGLENAHIQAGQGIRKAEASRRKVFNERYQAWDRVHGGKSAVIPGNLLADLLTDLENAVREARANATASGNQLALQAIGELEGSPLVQRLRQVGEGGLEVSVRELRELEKALQGRLYDTLPGDKARLLYPTLNRVQEMTANIVGARGAKTLRRLGADYRKFKETFVGNDYIRPFLDPTGAVQPAFRRLQSTEGAAAYKAAGQNTSLIARDALDTALNRGAATPDSVLQVLRDNPWISRELVSEGKELVQQLANAKGSINTANAVELSRRLSGILQDPSLAPTQRKLIQDLLNQVQAAAADTPAKAAIDRIIKTGAAREAAQTRLAAAQQATKAAKEGLQARQAASARVGEDPTVRLAQAVAEANTPQDYLKARDLAKKTGAEAQRAFADATIAKIFEDIERLSPLEIYQRFEANKKIIKPLLGNKDLASLQRLAEAEPQITAALQSAPVQRFLINELPGETARIVSTGFLRSLYKMLIKATMRSALRGTKISRQIDTILRGKPDTAGAELVKLLREVPIDSLRTAAIATEE